MSQEKIVIVAEDVHSHLDPWRHKEKEDDDGKPEITFISSILIPFQLKAVGGHGELIRNLHTKNYEFQYYE